jgi:hypothetical protein
MRSRLGLGGGGVAVTSDRAPATGLRRLAPASGSGVRQRTFPVDALAPSDACPQKAPQRVLEPSLWRRRLQADPCAGTHRIPVAGLDYDRDSGCIIDAPNRRFTNDGRVRNSAFRRCCRAVCVQGCASRLVRPSRSLQRRQRMRWRTTRGTLWPS